MFDKINSWKTGVIFDFKEFAVHDGPGLRQTVFLKGCPMRCQWCHNPEGLSPEPQVTVKVNECLHCGRCTAACTHSQCVCCGDCVSVCPERLRSISGQRVSSRQLADKILRNADFYQQCGGGVTFSGGEPLMQSDFVCETMDLLPNVHKAVETSGFASPESFLAVVLRSDLVMMDFKIFDDSLHKQYTGVSNVQIKNNLELLKKSDKPFIIRIPVIPCVNDNDENYLNTAALLADAENLLHVEFLPYHMTAGAKYTMVGMTYRPDFDVNSSVKINLEPFEQYNIRSRVL